MARRRSGSNGNQPEQTAPEPSSPPELIVVTQPDASVRVMEGALRSASGAPIAKLERVLSRHGASIEPLFGDPERLLAQAPAGVSDDQTPGAPRYLARFLHVDAPESELPALAEELVAEELVEAAYVKPATYLAAVAQPPRGGLDVTDGEGINDMQPSGIEAPPVTPDFTSRQAYLDPAPAGIDARYAWTIPGGSGSGVRVIDCEWAWNFTHEDLLTNSGGVQVGTSLGDTNHGTAVAGEIGGDRNVVGITGIAPDATVGAAAFSMPTATVIRQAADRLGPGDILLLEIHRAGPNATGIGQQGFIAVEWWPDDFAAIRYATNKGVIVVEAAGNGAQNLDDPIYSVRPAGFPLDWTNPFNRNNRDSGGIVVGAGAPPPGTHGRDWGPDRSRLDFSNFGSLVDAQGWGREVTTAGYGDLQGGSAIHLNEWYTDRFSGTSSASPIVVGAIAAVQGTLRAKGRIPLSPIRARDLLRSTGSLQRTLSGVRPPSGSATGRTCDNSSHSPTRRGTGWASSSSERSSRTRPSAGSRSIGQPTGM